MMVNRNPVYADDHIADDGAQSIQSVPALRRPVHPERNRGGRPHVTKDDSDVTLRTNVSSKSLIDGDDSDGVGLRDESERKQSFCERHRIDGLAEDESKKKKSHRFPVGKPASDAKKESPLRPLAIP